MLRTLGLLAGGGREREEEGERGREEGNWRGGEGVRENR